MLPYEKQILHFQKGAGLKNTTGAGHYYGGGAYGDHYGGGEYGHHHNPGGYGGDYGYGYQEHHLVDGI